MQPVVIEMKDVSMGFRINTAHISSLKEWTVRHLKGEKIVYPYFWALQNVDCTIHKGEVIGLIGRNGAGKSTFLKVVSGLYPPTKGSVAVNGRIVPMLELGSGFDLELTGHENIFLNGAVLGYTKEYISERYDEIVAFSELGDFIQMPLKTYSSGMVMRLAFSIATVVDPEILIVDEILAVGDEKFQQKSYERMMQLLHGGSTVLFVSHSIEQIRSMCDRVIWLEHGQIKMDGRPDVVCDAYHNS